MPDDGFFRTLVHHVLQLSKGRRVRVVYLAVGELRKANAGALQESWPQLTANTPAQDAALAVKVLPSEFQCMVCFEKYHPSGDVVSCPHCGSAGAKILSGEQFFIEAVE